MLNRDFTLPVTRGYQVQGTVTPEAGVPEPQLDHLAGSDGTIVAESSSRAFNLPTLRASQAVDGSPNTGWSPASPLGAWIRFTAPPRTVRSVTVTQPPVAWQGGWATRIEVLVDGRDVGGGAIGPGTHTVQVTPTTGRTVELRITAVSGSGTVRFLETDAAGGIMTFDASRAATACVAAGTLDGAPVLVHPLRPITSSAAVPFGPCPTSTWTLHAGPHQLRGSADWDLDTLVLRDQSESPQAPAVPPPVSATGGATSADVTVSAAAGPYYLVLGQAFDPRWSATMDGQDLGRPVTVDGWSAGWLIQDPGPHHLVIRYTPQRPATWALLLSLLGVGLCLLLVRMRPAAALPRLAGPPRLPRPSRWRRQAAWAALAATAWFLGGLVAGLTALVLAAWVVVRPPRPGLLIGIGLGLWVSLPAAFIVGNRGRWGSVNPALVTENPWPGAIALTGLVTLAVGIVLQSRSPTSGTLLPRGPGDPPLVSGDGGRAHT